MTADTHGDNYSISSSAAAGDRKLRYLTATQCPIEDSISGRSAIDRTRDRTPTATEHRRVLQQPTRSDRNSKDYNTRTMTIRTVPTAIEGKNGRRSDVRDEMEPNCSKEEEGKKTKKLEQMNMGERERAPNHLQRTRLL